MLVQPIMRLVKQKVRIRKKKAVKLADDLEGSEYDIPVYKMITPEVYELEKFC